MLLKISRKLNETGRLERNASLLQNWNLTRLDLENMEDDECIEALNQVIFDKMFQYKAKVDFDTLYKSLLRQGTMYGQNGFHKGFGKLFSDMFMEATMVSKDDTHYIPRRLYFVMRCMNLYMQGVRDTNLLTTMRRVMH